jgi:rhodanese-related sulfurtransferase
MKTLSSFIILSATLGLAHAVPEPSNPERRTEWGMYVNATEAAAMKQKLQDKVLFIDVRDPIEIMFTGFTNMVDINIPFKIANRSKWNPKKPVYQVELNPNFEQEVAAALKARGLGKDAPIIIMCRSGGTRGAPATRPLQGKGYKNVYVMTDGFEGGKAKSGDKKGWRLVDGWKNSGLPWSYKLNREKMYFPSESSRAALDYPVPQYMRIVMGASDQLGLTEKQQGLLKAWRDDNLNNSKKLMQDITTASKALIRASATGETAVQLQQRLEAIAALRMQLLQGRTKCRDNMRDNILTPKQWQQVVAMASGV